MSDDALDELYSVKPDGFTALRQKLADSAKQRGEAAVAKRISGARKPTTAAWVVNLLVLRHKDTKRRLSDLGDRLRAAHNAMDGKGIRRLSVEQHHLVEELVDTAFRAAELKNPSAALREDVTGTLQAAIADTEVTAELGRLAKTVQWSGFGGFDAPEPPSTTDDTSQRRDRLKAELAEARRRRDEARRNLRAAQRDLDVANEAYDKAQKADRAAAAAVEKAEARLRQQP
jgi:chromosome segregation ATPase